MLLSPTSPYNLLHHGDAGLRTSIFPLATMAPDVSQLQLFSQPPAEIREPAKPRSPQIIDSTLREGEQFSTAFFTTETKIAIARALDDFGVDFIEVTNPMASPQSRSDCERITKLGLKNSKIIAHIRCHMDDARLAVQCGVYGVSVLMGTSPQLRKNSHGMSMMRIAESAIEVTRFLQSHNVEVRFSSEDAFRSDQEELLRLYEAVDQLGIDRVGVADTVGVANPLQVYDFVSRLRRTVACDIEVHFHNDTGCATANAICAIEAGATHIDTTVLGIGERNGITPLGSLIAGLMVKDRTAVLSKYRTSKLKHLENLVAGTSGISIPFNNCITGSAAFSHKAGIHTKAILKDPSTYEILRPEDFGLTRSVIIASRLTGWNAIKSRGLQLGVEMTDAQFRSCTAAIKAVADKQTLTDADLDTMIRAFPGAGNVQ